MVQLCTMEDIGISEKKINQQWISESLWCHGDHLTDLFVESIEKVKLIDKGKLIDSLHFTVKNMNRLEYSFLTYGRIHDMNRKRQFGFLIEEPDTNTDVWGVKKTRAKEPMPKKWYAKNMYGSLNQLIAEISFGMTEQMRELMITQIKNKFPKPVTTNPVKS